MNYVVTSTQILTIEMMRAELIYRVRYLGKTRHPDKLFADKKEQATLRTSHLLYPRNLSAFTPSWYWNPWCFTQPLHKEASCRRRAIYPTIELAIIVIFFFSLFPSIHFPSITSIASVGTHERIAKICVSNYLLLRFLWHFENRQSWI